MTEDEKNQEERDNISINQVDSKFYKKSIFMTTHNSYQWSITEQLDQGIRGFELDIHDSWTIPEIVLGKILGGRYKGKFKVGHADPGHEVSRTGGNPRGNNLEKWLDKIGEWSRKRKRHAPITVFLDIKKDLIDSNNNPSEQFGLIRLNEQILNACKGRENLFTSQDFLENPSPTIGELRGKIIVVLMSFHTASTSLEEALKKESAFSENFRRWFIRRIKWIEEKSHLYHRFLDPIGALKTRVAYQEGRIKSDKKFKPICCVAFNPKDRDKTGFENSLERKSIFVTAYKKPEDYPTYQNTGRLVRADYQKVKGLWPPFPKSNNFPATDNWRDDHYRTVTDEWVKD